MPRHELSAEDRAKGGQAKAAKARAEREAREAKREERLDKLVDKAWTTLEQAMDGGNAAAVRAAGEVLNRYYGRPRQEVEHTGPDGGPVQIEIAQVRDRLNTRLADRASRRGAK